MNSEDIIKSKKITDYIKTCRWFQNKDSKIIDFKIHDVAIKDNIIFLIIDAQAGNSAYMYYFPLIIDDEKFIDTFEGHGVSDAIYSKTYAESISKFIENENEIVCNKGKIKFHKTEFFHMPPANKFSPVNAEQSNSSFILDNLIVKNYRYLQYGENPDIRMARVLIEYGFFNVPVPEGYGTYTSSEGTAYIINASAFVNDSRDLWSLSTDKISVICKENKDYKNKMKDIVDYTVSLSGILGDLTAKMHKTLFSVKDDDFIPEPVYREDFTSILNDTVENLDKSELFKDNDITIIEKNFEERIAALDLNGMSKFRIHGDYHLGQILSSDRLYVIDFEGEPMRPLAQRSKKQIPLRDIAGMIRSLSYLLYFSAGCINSEELDLIDKSSKNTFVESYKNIIKDSGIMPDNAFDMLDLFILQKASYELMYELKNRPSFVNIPLKEINKYMKK